MGVSIGKTTLRDISKTISDHIEPKIYPEIKEEIIDGKNCVSIDFFGENAPYFAYGRAYKRVSDEDRALSKSEIEIMILSKKKVFWDASTNSEFHLNDISGEKLKKYIAQTGLDYSSKKNVLDKLGLIKNRLLTNASIVLFGNEPSKYFNLLNLRCAVFSGNSKASSFIDMKDFNGDVFELIESAQGYILQHINVGMKIEGLKRIDVPEINQEAIREAIINAFCHRDYMINQEVQIAIFKDRVEILNPGKLFGGLKVKDIISRQVSMRRNELIADVFHRVHYIEKWGTGIGKIRKLEPETAFEEVGDFFLVSFKRKDAFKSEGLNEGLNEGLKSLLCHIIKHPNSQAKDIEKELKRPIKTIERQIKQLIGKNLIERKGSRKTGGYFAK
jgi:ATP-dependent DNA helicase RecG